MRLKSKLIVGFGVSDRESFNAVTRHTAGAIIGSAFVRAVAEAKDYAGLREVTKNFIAGVR
jgi:tryptophan synthase alpha chain